MKSIKNHLMFILPLMTILLSVEFFLVFGRTTAAYEQQLKTGYSMLLVTTKPVNADQMRVHNPHIATLTPIKRDEIVGQIVGKEDREASKEILSALPYFYTVTLDAYLSTDQLEKLKKDLESSKLVKRVETFGGTYASSYRLFSLVKLLLKLFIFFMALVSLFLIVKQMEIWRFEHRQRMEVMEIFGAPLMLRSGVLFKIALFDAIAAALLTALLFWYVKSVWALRSGIDIVMQQREKLFLWSDLGILLALSVALVTVSVFMVVTASHEEQE